MQKPKLLVVDDSHAVRVQVKRILANAGYQVLTAADGTEAIELLNEKPQLMVLDVNMPGLDGYGVCEKLREMEDSSAKLPVVFLTSLQTRALEFLGEEFGAYLHKPVAEEELLDAVKTQLELSTQS